jgi:hypothetical protein
MKKIFKNTIVSVMSVSLLTMSMPAFSFADAADKITVSLRIEGISENIFAGNVSYSSSDETVLASDLLKYADEEHDEFEISWTDSDYGAYITAVNGEAAATFGAWDGWMYQVNGEAPSVSVSSYDIKDGDDIVLYYAYMDSDTTFQCPTFTYDEITGVLTFTSLDTVGYDDNWNPIYEEKPVAGLSVNLVLNNEDASSDTQKVYGEYVTDEDGKIDISNETVAGYFFVTYEKQNEDGAPLVLRQGVYGAKTISVSYYIDVEVMVGTMDYIGKVNLSSPDEKLTVEQVLRQVDERYGDELIITWTETDYGAYISAVNGFEAGTYGAWDGWMYQVNREVPNVGVDSYYVSSGDHVILYYIYQDEEHPAQNPKFTYDAVTGILKFTSNDVTGYDSDWNPIYEDQPVVDLIVYINDDSSFYSLKTDENGEVNLRDNDIKAGEYWLTYGKYTEDGVSMVLPFADIVEFTFDDTVASTTTTTAISSSTPTTTTTTTPANNGNEQQANLGDVNNDGAVDALDASEILTIYAKIATSSTFEISELVKIAADVDGNGAIDALDASYVLSYYAYTATGGKNTIEEFLAA